MAARRDPEGGFHARVIDGEIADGYVPPSASMNPGSATENLEVSEPDQ